MPSAELDYQTSALLVLFEVVTVNPGVLTFWVKKENEPPIMFLAKEGAAIADEA